MTVFQIAALLVTLSAAFAYVNYQFIKLPMTVGVMVVSLVASVALLLISMVAPQPAIFAQYFLSHVDFDRALLHGMLAFLLFAGALNVDLSDLSGQRGAVLLLSTVGVLVSTAIVGVLSYYLLAALGLNIPWIYCFLFGALISPTDPVAVLSIARAAGAVQSLETKIAGESLFNDGVGVVVFVLLLEVAHGGGHMGAGDIAVLFLKEAVGGVLLGLTLGWITFLLLRQVDNYQVEILLTLALVMGGYALGELLHTSAPIETVVAGLLIGNHGRSLAMSAKTREHLDTFWELIDELLNVILFTLIGLEMLVLAFKSIYFAAIFGAILIVLLARAVSVGGLLAVMKRFRSFSPGATPILIWSGLRGGISVALALSIPHDAPAHVREVLLIVTYGVVVFSIIVQGLTIGRLVRKYSPKNQELAIEV